MVRRGIDALLVTGYGNRRYLSGYRAPDMGIAESSGYLLIPATGSPFLLTDSRYQVQAAEEAPGFEVLLYRQGLLRLLKPLLADFGVANLGFEEEYISHARAMKLIDGCGEAGVRVRGVSGMVERQRRVKDEAELAAIRASVQLNEAVFAEFLPSLYPGMSEREAALVIEGLMRSRGASGPSFPTIVAAGENSAKPHAEPSERKIKKGEPVIIDMGLVLDGYCSDMTRTVVLGPVAKGLRDHIRLVRRAQLAAIDAVRAGIEARVADRAARSIIRDAGHAEHFGHATGHGVGLDVHEAPSVGPKTYVRLRENMVVTVEPGVYIPGRAGVRLENMVVVTRDGCEVLNHDTSFLDI